MKKTNSMTAQEFDDIGRMCYGNQYKRDLAGRFGIGEATIWRYATGRSDVPVTTALAMKRLLTVNAER